MLWLIKQDVMDEMQRCISSGQVPSAKECTDYVLKCQVEASADSPRSFTQAGDVAEIRVEGVLTPKPSLFALIFGEPNTTYDDVQAAIAKAESDKTVKRVVFHVASPGGTVDGLFETLAAIQGMRKPRSVVASQADSAAYAIAAAVGKIRATGAHAEFGSIGVVASYFVTPEVVDVTSTNAPNKCPDVSTEEGKAVVRAYLDEIHDLFVDAIASGRGVSASRVNQEFGRGAVMLAGAAKRLGMVDSINNPSRVRAENEVNPEVETEGSEIKVAASAAVEKKERKMDADKLKAEYPDVYKAVFESGVAQERDRVTGHLNLGLQCEGIEPSGALKTAVGAINDGCGLTMKIQSEYIAAGMNRKDRTSAQADSDSAGGTLAGVGGEEPETVDIGDQVAARFEATKGVKA